MFQGVMPAHTQGLPRKPREQKPYTEVNMAEVTAPALRPV